jgi:hypothetical protein
MRTGEFFKASLVYGDAWSRGDCLPTLQLAQWEHR